MDLNYNELMCLKITANSLWDTDKFNIIVSPSLGILDINVKPYRISFYKSGRFCISSQSIMLCETNYNAPFPNLEDWVDIENNYTSFQILSSTQQKSINKLNKILKLKAFI
jgi:hypothetical protein